MSDNIEGVVISAICAETVETLPDTLLNYYRNPPGRRPGARVLSIKDNVAPLSDADVTEIVRDVVDQTVFSLLHLLDLEFKDKGIVVGFGRRDEAITATSRSLVELYREKIDPGGVKVG